MSCEEGQMRRRRPPRSPAPPPLEDDDLLSEILLRLLPLPSSLPRASAVCKRWRSLASDPAFSRRFRRHHRSNPPLLGFFDKGSGGLLSFQPTLEAPNRVPHGRFSLQLGSETRFFGCRHGLALIFDYKLLQFLVWDPVAGQKHHIAIPPRVNPTKAMVNGAVLRSAAGDVEHFRVALVVEDNKDKLNSRWLACVYSSETGVWGNLIIAPIPSDDSLELNTKPAVLVGDSLYWELDGSSLSILEFDLESESISVIPMSDDVLDLTASTYMLALVTVMRAEGGGLGLLCVWGFTAQLWKWNTGSDGVGSWEMRTTIELDKLLSLDSDSVDYPEIHSFAEDNNLVLLWDGVNHFTVQLESVQFKKLSKLEMRWYYHAFESIYGAGNRMPLHCWYTRTKFLF